MHDFVKQATAVFLNFALFTNQLLADLPPITFDTAEWVPFQSVGTGSTPGWQLFSGDALISSTGQGYGGGKSLKIPVSSQQEARLSRAITWNVNEKTAFIDLQVKPAADPEGSLATFYANGTQIAFQVPAGSATGEVWVYHGDDGITDPNAPPVQWIKTAGTFPVAAGATTSSSYVRMTLRHDYFRNLWDLFINGKLAAANLGFKGRLPNLTSLEFYGSNVGDTMIDDLSAMTQNMLFPDADKDGLSDAWENANGSNPNVYDRDSIKAGTGRSFLDLYMESLWTTTGVNAGTAIPPSGGIPPLTIDSEASHVPVTALKGAMSIGGDGSANYSIPIDIPKGTAGMEPKVNVGYSSSGGNGIMGLGWNITGLQRITRGPSTAAKDGEFDPADFDANDRFFLDGERLVCVNGTYGAPGSEYRTEMDSYARITAVGGSLGAGPASWKVETKAGLNVFLGQTADSRTSVSAGTLTWGVNEVMDTVGNYYSVEYDRDPATTNYDFLNDRVVKISYTGKRSIVNGVPSIDPTSAPYCSIEFSYENRPDITRTYTKYAGYRMTKRLAKISVKTGTYINHSYAFFYANSYQSGRSLLTSVRKMINDQTSKMLLPTFFNYDGIQQGEDIWRNPGANHLPTYGTGLDATGEVNSIVSVENDNTAALLSGDVSRAYLLTTPVTLNANTRISFDFKSQKQHEGALIGVDDNRTYEGPSTPPFYRIGGTAPINMSNDRTFPDPGLAYSTTEYWKNFNKPFAGTGTRSYLVMMCVDNDSSDGYDNATFANVRIYDSSVTTPELAPILHFAHDLEIPRLLDASGKDLGVVVADLNSDGLPDIADWRATNYTNGIDSTFQPLVPQTGGQTFRNVEDDFVTDFSIRPPTSLPLGCRSSDTAAFDYNKKHHLLAQPMDIDADGTTDLIGSLDIQRKAGQIKNQYGFYNLVNGAWVEKAGWRLPFSYENVASTAETGGNRRDEHFQWVDMNSDGYLDLIVHTTSSGRLYSLGGSLILGGNGRIAYLNNTLEINKGNGGPRWIRDDSYALPESLTEGFQDVGRRIVDVDGDGVVDMAESSIYAGGILGKTYKRNQAGANRWNSDPGLQNPPSSQYDFPIALTTHDNAVDQGVMLMDLNGDGMVDLMQSQKAGSTFVQKTYVNQGSRNNAPWKLESVPGVSDADAQQNSYCLSYPLHYELNNARIPYGFEMGDINGDGLVDIVYSDVENTATTGVDNLAFLNTGNGWAKREEWGIPGTNRIFSSTAAREAGKRNAKLMDLNGDGFPDLVINILDSKPIVFYNNCRPEVMTKATDGYGSEIGITYSRLNDPSPIPGFGTRVYDKGADAIPAGQTSIIDARLVVSGYSEQDANGGSRWRYQRYGDLRYDRTNEASLGFGWVEGKDNLNQQVTRTETSRTYPFGGSPVRTRSWVNVTNGDLRSSLPGVTAGQKLLSEETATYDVIPSPAGVGGKIVRPIQTGSIKILYDLTGAVVSQTTTTQSNFDAFGFVGNSTVTSLDLSTIVTANTYEEPPFVNGKVPASAPWFLGRLKASVVTKSAPGKATSTKNCSFEYDPANGLLTQEFIEKDDPNFGSTKTYGRDAFGNITSTTVTAAKVTGARSSSASYRDNGRFLEYEVNQLGHTVAYSYDSQNALLLSTTDISGLTTRFGYDMFGTRIRTYHPDGTMTGESTGYWLPSHLPSSVSALTTNTLRYFRAEQTSGSPVKKIYLDSQGHELVAESMILRDGGANGASRYAKIYTVTQYDALGRKTRVYEPFGADDAVKRYTQIEYDVVGRVMKTTRPHGEMDTVQIMETVPLDGQPTAHAIVQNSNGMLLERWEDQHGRLVKSKDPSTQTTKFTHDVEGRMISVAVNEVPLLTNTFDKLGNKLGVWEKNSGSSSSTYNALGETLTSTNAKGQTTTYTTDAYGRPKTVAKPEGTYTTTYSDASGPSLGKPISITGTGGAAGYQETLSYDNLGRPNGTTKTQFGETFTTSTIYDALGRVYTETDAGGLTVLHEYDAAYSFPTKLSIGLGSPGAGTVLWRAGTSDSKGRATSQTLAQGVTTAAAYDEDDDGVAPAPTGQLRSLTATQGTTTLQSKVYKWQTIGNLDSRLDAISGRLETFVYDGVNRVTQAAVSGAGAPPVANFTYDDNGNLKTKAGASLTYGDIASIHRVTSATIKGAPRSYTYDAAGYVTNDGKRSYTWTSFGQLSSLDYQSAPVLQNLAGTQIYAAARVQTNFEFDAGGNRAFQKKERIATDQTRVLEETLYLGGYEREIHSTRASGSSPPVTTRTVHRHSLGGFAVYTRTDTAATANTPAVTDTKLTTILKDHLGSTDVLYTGTWNGSTFANATTERQAFDSWGERRDPTTLVSYRATDGDPFRTSGQDYDRGYTGHEQLDDSGLIHMNGRIYDPELGRMLSPDPVVQIPEFSQNFNRYSYVLNNPLNKTDPSGFSIWNTHFRVHGMIANWVKENWRTVVVIVVVAVLTYFTAGAASGWAAATYASLTTTATGVATAVSATATIVGNMVAGAYIGAVAGALSSALAGGDMGDVLRGAAIGGISGALTGGMHAVGGTAALDAANVAGHGVIGGATNVVMGGKFQDGFLAAAASAATAVSGYTDPETSSLNFAERTAVASIAGGTASAIGGGKFANGAVTGAMTHLLNAELGETFKNQKFRNAMLSAGDQLATKGFEKEYAMRIGEKGGEFVFGSIVTSNSEREVSIADVKRSELPEGAIWVGTMHSHPHSEQGNFCVYTTNKTITRFRTSYLSENDVLEAKTNNMIIGVVVPNQQKSIEIAHVVGNWKSWQTNNSGSEKYLNSKSYYYDNMSLEKIR